MPPKMTYLEVQGDLFSCPISSSMAHCVSEDLAMGKGVATLFKEKFGGIRELKAQGIFDPHPPRTETWRLLPDVFFPSPPRKKYVWRARLHPPPPPPQKKKKKIS